mgnify:CR=1 FL=1
MCSASPSASSSSLRFEPYVQQRVSDEMQVLLRSDNGAYYLASTRNGIEEVQLSCALLCVCV